MEKKHGCYGTQNPAESDATGSQLVFKKARLDEHEHGGEARTLYQVVANFLEQTFWLKTRPALTKVPPPTDRTA